MLQRALMIGVGPQWGVTKLEMLETNTGRKKNEPNILWTRQVCICSHYEGTKLAVCACHVNIMKDIRSQRWEGWHATELCVWRLTCRHNHRIVHRQCPIDRQPESCYYLALAHGPPPSSCYTTAEPPHPPNLPTRPTLLSASLSSSAASRSGARALLPSPTPPLRAQNKGSSTNSISKMVQQKQQALQQHPLLWLLRMSADHCKRGRRGRGRRR